MSPGFTMAKSSAAKDSAVFTKKAAIPPRIATRLRNALREGLAARRLSRQHLAEAAKISISTLEKALGGRRPFTLATTVRPEEALGVSLRKDSAPPAPAAGEVAPDGLGAYSRRAVNWM